MTLENFTAEADVYVRPLLSPEAWSELSADKQHIIILRAQNDIYFYIRSVANDIDIDLPEIKFAVFEQIIHIAESLCRSNNGKVLTDEQLNEFGSRKYHVPDETVISPRSMVYLKKILAPDLNIRIMR